ncbi:MAG: hypothetical protein MZV65_54235 [Chromatiales bacterium]|nr:hypothetical protein [Chromatiales bacterium]
MGDNRRFLCLTLVLLAGVVTGCVVTPAQPLTAAEHQFGQAEDERKLIRRSSELDDELRRKGLVLQDERVNAYVSTVGGRVVPAAAARARFRSSSMSCATRW